MSEVERAAPDLTATEPEKLLTVSTPQGTVTLERVPAPYVSYMVYRAGVYIGQVSKVQKWGINLRYGGFKTRAEALEQVQKWPSPGNDVATESEADEHARWLGHQAYLRGNSTNPFDEKRRPKSRAAWQAAFGTGAARLARAKAKADQATQAADSAAHSPASKSTWPFPKWDFTTNTMVKA